MKVKEIIHVICYTLTCVFLIMAFLNIRATHKNIKALKKQYNMMSYDIKR